MALDRNELQDLAEGLSKAGIAQETTLQELVKILAGDKGMASLAKATGKTKEELKKTQSYLKDFADELDDTSESMSGIQKVNNTLAIGIGIVTSDLKGLGASASLIGEQFGETGKIFGDTMAMLIDGLSRNVDFYRALSEIGGTVGQGLNDLRKVAGTTGLTMDQLNSALLQAGPNLALLGGTTGQGVKNFTDAITSLSSGETFDKFVALGFTMDEIATGAADYLEIQTQLGRTQNLNAQQLASQTTDYLNNLDLLTRLTGKNRKALADEMKARANDTRLSLQLSGMSQAQQKEINSALSMTGAVSKDMEQSITNLIATDGVATNAREAGILAIDGMREAIHGLARGETGSAEQLMKVFQTAANETANMSAEEKQRYAQLKQLGVDFFDVRFETIGFKNAMGDMTEAQKQQKKAQEIGTGSALKFNKATQRLTVAFQALLAPIADVLSSVIGGLSSVIEGLASGLQSLSNYVTDVGAALIALLGILGTKKVASMALGAGGKAIGAGASYLSGKVPNFMKSKTSTPSFLNKAGAGGGGLLGGMGTGMKGLAGGLKAFANPQTVLGATAFSASIAIIGAGLAAATWLMGGALNKFAEGLSAVGDVDGKNLSDVAVGTTKLAGAMVLMAGGSSASVVTGFFGKIFGGGPENFAKSLNKTLEELDKDKIDMYANSLENLGNAMTSLRSGMTGVTKASANSTGDKLERLNNTMEQILHVLDEGNKYSRITSKATSDTAENFG